MSSFPAPASTVLRAGPLQLVFNPADGSVRYLCAGGLEVLRGISAPVRDRAWETVRPRLSDVTVAREAEAFRVTFNARCTSDVVDFEWRGEITGDAAGTLDFTFDGRALRDFERNRIGFCVLHQAELHGAACTIEHVDGSTTTESFPDRIVTGAPHTDIRALRHRLTPDCEVEVRMEGETFEMEDQRNWTDASFKTYCTTLRLPRPVRLARGTRIQQRISVRLLGTVAPTPSAFSPPWQPPAEAVLEIGEELPHGLPALGLGWSDVRSPAQLVEFLRPLAPAHLRVDLWLRDPGHARLLQAAATAATTLGAALEIGVFADEDIAVSFARLCDGIRSRPPLPRVVRWLVFDEAKPATPAGYVATVRELLAGQPFAAPVGGGATDNFTELNYHPAVASVADFTAHAANPQVHAFDEASMVETLAIQGLTVENARLHSGGRPAVVSPVTFTRRWRLDDAGAPTGLPANVMPFQSDDRIGSAFAGAWLAGSFAQLARHGAASVTAFETLGANGLFTASGKPRATAHAFALLARSAGAKNYSCTSSHPLHADAVAFAFRGSRWVVAANLRGREQAVRLTGANGSKAIRLGPYSLAALDFA